MERAKRIVGSAGFAWEVDRGKGPCVDMDGRCTWVGRQEDKGVCGASIIRILRVDIKLISRDRIVMNMQRASTLSSEYLPPFLFA